MYYDLNVKQSMMQAGYYMIACTFLVRWNHAWQCWRLRGAQRSVCIAALTCGFPFQGNCCVQLALLVVGSRLVGAGTMEVSS